MRIGYAVLAAALACISCAPPTDDVTAITASYVRCFESCRTFDLSLDRAQIADPAVAQAFADLPLDAIEHCPGPSATEASDHLMLMVAFGPHHLVACHEPASGETQGNGAAARIRAFVATEMRNIHEAMMRPRRAAILDALRNDTLQGVLLKRTGCYGSCPAYTLHVARDGTAVIDAVMERCKVHARATIDFTRVRDALFSSGASGLEPTYPLVWVDTPGATLTLELPNATFSSTGPDARSWGEPFREVLARLDQLVLDTHWSAPLPPRSFSAIVPARCR